MGFAYVRVTVHGRKGSKEFRMLADTGLHVYGFKP